MAEIRPMMPRDVEAVLNLWKATEGLTMREADSPEALRTYLERNPGMSFVAQANGQLIGAVLCGHDGRHGYLQHLAAA